MSHEKYIPGSEDTCDHEPCSVCGLDHIGNLKFAGVWFCKEDFKAEREKGPDAFTLYTASNDAERQAIICWRAGLPATTENAKKLTTTNS